MVELPKFINNIATFKITGESLSLLFESSDFLWLLTCWGRLCLLVQFWKCLKLIIWNVDTKLKTFIGIELSCGRGRCVFWSLLTSHFWPIDKARQSLLALPLKYIHDPFSPSRLLPPWSNHRHLSPEFKKWRLQIAPAAPSSSPVNRVLPRPLPLPLFPFSTRILPPTALSSAHSGFMAEPSALSLGPCICCSFCQNALFPDGRLPHPSLSSAHMSPSKRCLPWPSCVKTLRALLPPLPSLSFSPCFIFLRSTYHHPTD